MLEKAYWEQLGIFPTYEYHENYPNWFHGSKPEHPSFLYRALNVEGGLLYVGITDHFWDRLRDHRRESPWFIAAKNIFIYGCSNRMEAAVMEKLSIMVEAPIFNIQGNPQNAIDVINVEPVLIKCLNCDEFIEAAESKSFCVLCKDTLESQGVKFCAFSSCDGIIDSTLGTGRKYCNRKCRNADWYLNNINFHQSLYQMKKSIWEKSETGKLAGVNIYEWVKLPFSIKDSNGT